MAAGVLVDSNVLIDIATEVSVGYETIEEVDDILHWSVFRREPVP